MSQKRSKKRSGGVGRKSLRTLLIRVFEKHNTKELTHKEICQIVDARDPNARQNVFDELNVLFKHGSVDRINHFTFKAKSNLQYLEGQIDIPLKCFVNVLRCYIEILFITFTRHKARSSLRDIYLTF